MRSDRKRSGQQRQVDRFGSVRLVEGKAPARLGQLDDGHPKSVVKVCDDPYPHCANVDLKRFAVPTWKLNEKHSPSLSK